MLMIWINFKRCERRKALDSWCSFFHRWSLTDQPAKQVKEWRLRHLIPSEVEVGGPIEAGDKRDGGKLYTT